jgi:hypothetical protein
MQEIRGKWRREEWGKTKKENRTRILGSKNYAYEDTVLRRDGLQSCKPLLMFREDVLPSCSERKFLLTLQTEAVGLSRNVCNDLIPDFTASQSQ